MGAGDPVPPPNTMGLSDTQTQVRSNTMSLKLIPAQKYPFLLPLHLSGLPMSHRAGPWGPERLSNFPHVTQEGSGRAGLECRGLEPTRMTMKVDHTQCSQGPQVPVCTRVHLRSEWKPTDSEAIVSQDRIPAGTEGGGPLFTGPVSGNLGKQGHFRGLASTSPTFSLLPGLWPGQPPV